MGRHAMELAESDHGKLDIQSKSNFERHLMLDRSIFVDQPTGADNFKPMDVADRFSGSGKRFFDRLIRALMGSTDNFGELINVILHNNLHLMRASIPPMLLKL
jgi:hypothetical protein